VALVTGSVGGYALNRVLSAGETADVTLGDSGEDAEPVGAAAGKGEQFPDVEVIDVEGQPVRTGPFLGRPLVVNLWYAACPPCRREMPDFAEVSDEYEGRVRFVGINLLDDVDRMLAFATETGVSYELYRDPVGAFNEAIGAIGYPTTVFVDAAGQVVEHHTGALDADELRSRLDEAAMRGHPTSSGSR
jgi:thiol-disulfide isomerase/thioredoxin